MTRPLHSFWVITDKGGFKVFARSAKHAQRSMTGKGHHVIRVKPRGFTPDIPYYRWERKP
jgi:hypothetical protein